MTLTKILVPSCFYCLNCTKFGQFIVIKDHVRFYRLKCFKIDFRWGSAPDPAGETYSVSPDLLAAFKAPTSKGKKGKEMKREGAGKERERRERTGAPFNFLPQGAADVVTPLGKISRKRSQIAGWFQWTAYRKVPKGYRLVMLVMTS